MKRILWAIAATILVVSPVLVGATAAGDTNVMTRSGRVNPAALREMLLKGLKATRDDEKLFIAHVVQQVAVDELPVSFVYASYTYARKRRPDYPFPYFQHSLRTLCIRNKIEI